MFLPTGSGQLMYVYDGSFDGLMTVIYEISRKKIIDFDIIAGNPDSFLLFHDYIHIQTDPDKAQTVIRAINTTLPSLAYKRVVLGYLSDTPGSLKYICNYLAMGWRHGMLLDHYLAHEQVKPLIDLSEKVIKEQHRMLGLVRFRHTMDKIYYAPIEPDHNILPLISSHFAKRMSKERWIIHDTGRNIASLYQQGEWDIVDFAITETIDYDHMEPLWQELWNSYVAIISIKERKNKQLQRKFLPKRYWKHLVEQID